MSWLSAGEIEPLIDSLPQPNLLSNCYAASEFLENAFYSASFEPSQVWREAVVLSEQGQKISEQLREAGVAPDFRNFTLFRLFYFHDLLVDYRATDFKAVLGELGSLQKTRTAKWPYVFGHLLYHKFNNDYEGNRTAHLEATDVNELLENTPSGIFQIGTLLSGPLGFLVSRENRITPPTLSLPLWHCSDVGCQTLHLVRARQYDSPQLRDYRTVVRFLQDRNGPPSEWGMQLARLASGARHASGRPYADMPALIGDSVHGPELETLVRRALCSPCGVDLRASLHTVKGLRGNPEQMIKALTREEQQQLILTLTNFEIVNFLDELIARREIDIPASEMRRPKTYAYKHHADCGSQISSLGARSTKHPPLVRLYAEICNAYSKLGLTEDLAWRVRQGNSPSLDHAVMDFLRAKGPESAVKELIFPTKSVTSCIGAGLPFQILENEEQDEACRRFLWKLGFSVPRYGDEYQILRNRIAEFKSTVLLMPSRLTESDRARVRSVGVNLFVSVEKFLADLLIYNVWLLASDHLVATKFTYTPEDAAKCIPRTLGGEIPSGDQTLRWRVDGENTLGVLLGYLEAFKRWVKARVDADKLAVRRDNDDYPHYAQDPLWTFPFQHTELWADVPPAAYALYLATIESICAQVAQAELANIRNGLDHNRDEAGFPSTDKMLACASRLEQIVDLADNRILIPKLYWGVGEERDLHGKVADTFVDYRGCPVKLWGPSPIAGIDRGRFGIPYVIAPSDFLNIPNSILIFSVSPQTLWHLYWKDYPRRRYIPSEPLTQDAQDFGDVISRPADDTLPQVNSLADNR